MKLSYKIVTGLSFVAAAGIILYMARKSRTKRMLNQISDEGYETAQDILFPGRQFQNGTLHYGPVIPQ